MAVRKGETFEPVTVGHIRSHGCRDLLVYCGSINCNHSVTMNADHMPEKGALNISAFRKPQPTPVAARCS